MFENRLIYFFQPIPSEAPHEAQKQSTAEQAKKKMDQMMPPKATELSATSKQSTPNKNIELKYQQTSILQEAKRTDASARADIIAFYKEGKKMNPHRPIHGIDKNTYRQIINALKNPLPKEHFATNSGVNVDINGKTFYFAAVYDETTAQKIHYFYRKETNFDPSSRTFLRSVSDQTYKKLTGQDRKTS